MSVKTGTFRLWRTILFGVLVVFFAATLGAVLAGDKNAGKKDELDLRTVVDEWVDTKIKLENMKLRMGTRVVANHVQVFPLFLEQDTPGNKKSKKKKTKEKISIIPLTTAYVKRLVRIKEPSGVVVYNNSGSHVFASCGEMIIGGSQDRMIACDHIIPPNKGKPSPLKVY
jgi:hypothetical protein